MNIFEAGNDAFVDLAIDQRLTVRGILNDVYAVSGLGLSAGLIATTRGETTFGPYPVAGRIRLHSREHRGSYGITDSSNTSLFITTAAPNNSDGMPDGARLWIQIA